MLNVIKLMAIQQVKYWVRSKITWYIVALVLVALCANKAMATELNGMYQFRGAYKVQNIVLMMCEDCWLELPPDYLHTDVVLSVNTDSEKDVFKALQSASRGVGWSLSRAGKKLRAEPIQNDGNVVFISCMDNQPKNVPKYLYGASLQADRLQCAKRDSVLDLEARRADSSRTVLDSIKAIPPLDFRHYELRYYSYSKGFTDRLGVEFGDVIASGNLHDKFKIYDDWKFYATQLNDTTFNFRTMYFSLDSTLNVDWGSEEQVLQKTYLNDGVVTQDYEWRKYGLIVQITREGRRVKMVYTFRDKDNSVSVLQGSVVGLDGDTLFLQGNYSANREVVNGVPVLSNLPIVGYLFSTHQTINDIKEFELYLIPQKRETLDTLSMRSIERVAPIYKAVENERDSTSSKADSQGD